MVWFFVLGGCFHFDKEHMQLLEENSSWNDVPTGPHLGECVCSLVVSVVDEREVKSVEIGFKLVHLLVVGLHDGYMHDHPFMRCLTANSESAEARSW